MKKLLLCLFVVLIPLSAVAEHHEPVADEIRAMEETFNSAYAANEVDKYFSFYADDASLYFYGERQDVAAYHDDWQATIAAGSAVEKNDLSDMRIQVMPGGAVAIATFFVDYRLRSEDGEVTTAKAFETDVWLKIDGEWKIVSLHYTEIPPA